MSLAVTGIGLLVTHDPERPVIAAAALVAEAGCVAWTGTQDQLPEAAGEDRLDAGGRCVIPGFVDAHTHMVFGGDRAQEFAARLAGRPYEAGGIRTTVTATRAATTSELGARVRRLATEALRGGTTTIEVKSGYGLTVEDEHRSLEAATWDAPDLPAVQRTFLGAHVVPEGTGADDYVALVAGPMLDACAPLAQWCDVFCDRGAFDVEQAEAILRAGRNHGLGLRLHAEQLAHTGGAQLAAGLGAASADHLTHIDDADIAALAGAGVVATLLPIADMDTAAPPPPARRLLDAGVTVALATDCNPGTSYTTSMALVIAMACRRYGMAPDEALRAATLGGAASLQRDDIGHLRVGARADLVVLDADDPVHLAYRPGVPLTHAVMRGGTVAWSAK